MVCNIGLARSGGEQANHEAWLSTRSKRWGFGLEKDKQKLLMSFHNDGIRYILEFLKKLKKIWGFWC
jgi:hypothetical protein